MKHRPEMCGNAGVGVLSASYRIAQRLAPRRELRQYGSGHLKSGRYAMRKVDTLDWVTGLAL